MVGQLKLGVYTAINPKNTSFPCYRQTGFLKELSELGLEMNIQVVVFDENGVDFGKKQCQGIRWFKDNWHFVTVPLPRVIYDRYQNFRLTGKSHAIRQKLCRTPGIQVFNSISTDKWLVYRLMRQAGLGEYLPSTTLVNNPAAIERVLGDFDNLWLKPCKGSQGRGIYLLSRMPKKGWRVWNIDNADHTGSCDYFSERLLVKNLYQAVQHSGRNYLIQEGIATKRIEGNPFDIRVLVQRDDKNCWFITGQGLRISGADRKVTNLIQGGKAEHFSMLQQYLPSRKAFIRVKRQIMDLALRGAEAIAKQKGLVAELGIDILLSRDDRPIFIEANTRPGRKIFKLTGQLDIRQVAHQRVLGYARYLLTHGQ